MLNKIQRPHTSLMKYKEKTEVLSEKDAKESREIISFVFQKKNFITKIFNKPFTTKRENEAAIDRKAKGYAKIS